MTSPEPVETRATAREAELTIQDGSALGACLYLTPEDLRALGVNPATAEKIEFSVDEDTEHLVVESVSNREGDQ